MILVDIGNTTIHFGVVDDGGIRDFRLPTAQATVPVLRKILREFPDRTIIVCSVVPRATALFRKLKRHLKVVGEDVKIPLRSRYNARQIGQDRLLNAFAARIHYPRVRLVIDFGTATTFDFINGKGEYAGGFIFPGVSLSYSALAQCALLTNTLKPLAYSLPDIPTNTSDSIHKGVREGSGILVNAWVKKYRSWITAAARPGKGQIVITGGQAPWVLSYLEFPFSYEPCLLFKGMTALLSRCPQERSLRKKRRKSGRA